MYRVYFDGNEGTGDGRYGLWLGKSRRDLAQIPGGPQEGMTVTIYMVGEIEAEATLQWDDSWDGWTARAIESTFRDNHETWDDDAHRTQGREGDFDWKALAHAYGEASDIPVLIDELRRDPGDARWSDLWSCLCHQGTVYSASYAALSLLCDLAKTLPPEGRLDPLMLIGAIIAADDLHAMDRRPAVLIEPLLPELRSLVDESMRTLTRDPVAFVHLLQAASAFAGDLFWGRHLDHLADGEFPGACPACGRDLRLAIAIHGCFVTAQDHIDPRNQGARRNPIEPADLHDLPDQAAWLHATAIAHDQRQVAFGIRHVFGTAVCPACHCALRIDAAIAEVYAQGRRRPPSGDRE